MAHVANSPRIGTAVMVCLLAVLTLMAPCAALAGMTHPAPHAEMPAARCTQCCTDSAAASTPACCLPTQQAVVTAVPLMTAPAWNVTRLVAGHSELTVSRRSDVATGFGNASPPSPLSNLRI